MIRKTRPILVVGAILYGLMWLAAPARANSIVETVGWGPTDASNTATVSIPTFNTRLGTLTGITIGGDASMTASLVVDNFGDFTESFTGGYVSVPVTIQQAPGYSFTETSSQTLSASGISGSVDPYPAEALFPADAASASFPTQSIASNEWPTFESLGPASLNVDVVMPDFSADGTDGVTLYFGASGTASGHVIVTYDYTPTPPAVPEPATMSVILVASAIGAVTVFGRRRNVTI